MSRHYGKFLMTGIIISVITVALTATKIDLTSNHFDVIAILGVGLLIPAILLAILLSLFTIVLVAPIALLSRFISRYRGVEQSEQIEVYCLRALALIAWPLTTFVALYVLQNIH